MNFTLLTSNNYSVDQDQQNSISMFKYIICIAIFIAFVEGAPNKPRGNHNKGKQKRTQEGQEGNEWAPFLALRPKEPEDLDNTALEEIQKIDKENEQITTAMCFLRFGTVKPVCSGDPNLGEAECTKKGGTFGRWCLEKSKCLFDTKACHFNVPKKMRTPVVEKYLNGVFDILSKNQAKNQPNMKCLTGCE